MQILKIWLQPQPKVMQQQGLKMKTLMISQDILAFMDKNYYLSNGNGMFEVTSKLIMVSSVPSPNYILFIVMAHRQL